ncbi:MBL fold metallo-hydrolase [bacterium]|nr:MBL fold metallo-hydrolase [bacterium]
MNRVGLGSPRTVDLAIGVHAILDLTTIGEHHAANVGLVTTRKALVFINSGQTEAQARAIWDFAKMTAPHREMAYLVLTHHHLDHCFATSFFDDRHALIYGHRSFSSCMAEMRKHLGQHDYQGMLMEMLKMTPPTFRQTVGDVHPVAPHRHVGEELTLAINGEEIMFIHLPGHTRSELVVYHPRSKVLFAGDAINTKAGPVTLFGDVKDWQKWISGLEKLTKLEIEKVVPGHGDIAGPEIIQQHIAALEKKVTAA